MGSICRSSSRRSARRYAEYGDIIERLRKFADDTLYVANRKNLFHASRKERRGLQRRLTNAFRNVPAFAQQLGVEPGLKFEVHRLHAAMRVGRNERPTPQLIVRLTQEKALKGTIGGTFRGGSTLVVDLTAAEVKYCIVKGVSSQSRQMRTLAFHAGIGADPLQRLLLSADAGEPFGLLHAFGEHV